MIAANKMPVLFIGHGSPENAIEDNAFSRNWEKAAASLPRPEAILCISAHWQTQGTAVTAMEKPKTIHDFYGFPDALYKVRYNAKGSPDLAKEIKRAIKSTAVRPDHEWGLDHGTWSVLVRMYPKADIPVLQLSLDVDLSPEGRYRIGTELAGLRSHGVLILGSGNAVHNLERLSPKTTPFDWAREFDAFVKENLEGRNDDALVRFAKHPVAQLAHPTDEHYLPLLYVLGASIGEKALFFNESFFMGSLSMRCALFGLDNMKI
jgi:4,5-DOPA dioxygenase extradiol